MKTFNINDVNNTDEVVVDLFIKRLEIKMAKNNKLYIEGNGINNNLDINFKKWEATQEQYNKLKNIKFMRIKGIINEYNGIKQIILSNYKEIPEDNIVLSDYMPSSNLNINDVQNFFDNIINSLNNDKYKKIINELLIDAFYIQGASTKYHHNKNMGLLEHTYQMLNEAKLLIDNDKTGLYKNVNTDLLYTAILLHDIGKIEELESNEYGIIEKYSYIGELLGHIIICVQQISQACNKLNIDIFDNDIVLLTHCIISHHGRPEWGSNKYPMIIEAQILFQLDYNSTHIDMFNNILSEINDNEFSNRQFLMNDRKIYKNVPQVDNN